MTDLLAHLEDINNWQAEREAGANTPYLAFLQTRRAGVSSCYVLPVTSSEAFS